MKNFTLPSLTVVLAASLINWSCSKINWKDIDADQKQQVSKCDVAEYHISTYDQYNLGFPFLFKKKYDQSGKKVKEIDCSFWSAIPPDDMRHHVLLVHQKDHRLYLLDKNNPNDTVMKVHLNNKGRVEYYETNGSLDWGNGATRTFGSFVYKSNRLVLFRWAYTNSWGTIPFVEQPLDYDSQGNLLAFAGHTYEYDYTRTAAAQFYIDDFMGGFNNGYYLLQYLGFFPEVTSPPNLRSYVNATVFVGNVENHTFDAGGKLTGYQFTFLQTTIVWNCK